MSINATRKELKETFCCVGVDYCGAQYLLKYNGPIFYNCGYYGWNFDGYLLTHSKTGHRILLTTGYRNIIHNEYIPNDYEIIRKYEKQAEEIANTSTREQAQKIIDNMIEELRTVWLSNF